MDPGGYMVWRADLLMRVAPLAVGAALCAWFAYRSLRIIVRHARLVRAVRLGTRGTSELEFTLALPVFLCSILIVIQLTLMINANIVVDYAAFTAARSAIVWIPQETDGEGAGTVIEPSRSAKLARVQNAAILACLPLSPKITDFAAQFVRFREATAPVDPAMLAQYASQADRAPAGIDRLTIDILQRWPYANEHTLVELLNDAGEPAAEFAPGGYVTVRVTHRFLMQVPLAGGLLGMAFGDRFVPFIGPFYIPISSSYRLLVARS